MLAFNNFLANITVWSHPVCCPSRLGQMSPRCVLIFLNSFKPFTYCIISKKKCYPECGCMLTLAVVCLLVIKPVFFTLKNGPTSLHIKLYIVFTAANQSGDSEMITTCQIAYVYMTCTPESSSIRFELTTLSVMSEKNGCHVNMVSNDKLNKCWTKCKKAALLKYFR